MVSHFLINRNFKAKAVFFVLTTIFVNLWFDLPTKFSEMTFEKIDCERPSKDCFKLNVSDSEPKAFYFETSGRALLSPRQVCGLESLALHNPNLTIFVFMTTSNDTAEGFDYFEAIKTRYARIRKSKLELSTYFAGTPLEHWFLRSNWTMGPFKTVHLSDALRVLSLWKYGGYYFDFDIIHLRPITQYINFLALEDQYYANSAALHAERNHPLFAEILKEFNLTYRGDLWAHNGPGCITRTLKRYCNQSNPVKWNYITCNGFNIFPYSTFYPHYYLEAHEFFKPNPTHELTKWFSDLTLAAHIWNSRTQNLTVKKSSSQLYVQLAKSHCPMTLQLAPDVF